jgi:putative tricarboxylic transport membrane protein
VLMGVLLYGLFDYLLDVPLPLGLFEAFVES